MSASAGTGSEHNGKEAFFDEEIQHQFYELIRSATQNIIFVTPYIELWVHLQDEMRVALARGVDITFLIREDATPRRPEDLEWFRANRIKVYLVPNLHAKIYLNEKRVIVSSMNIHRTSIIDSKDFAMVVKNEDVAKMFREYVSSLIGKAAIPKASRPIRDYVSGLVEKAAMTPHSFERQTSEDGYCIRSRDKIPFNTGKPLCADCFRQWNKYQDEDYEEKYCHSCGKSTKTSFAKPLCMACWKKSN